MNKWAKAVLIIAVILIILIVVFKLKGNKGKNEMLEFLESNKMESGLIRFPVQLSRLNLQFEEKDLIFNSSEEIKTFKADKLEKLGGFLKEPIKYDNIELEKVAVLEKEEFTIEKFNVLLYNKGEGVYIIPAYMMIPKQGKDKYPAIIGMHGHWGEHSIGKSEFLREDMPSFKAKEIVKNGYIFFAFDSVLFGERRYNWNNSDENTVQLNAQKLYLMGYSLMEFIIQEDNLFLNIVANHPKVDKNKISCIGHSFGGVKCLWLSALNEDLDTAVLSGSVISDSFMIHPFTGIKMEWSTLMPNLLNYTDTRDLLVLASPKKLFIINGYKDPICNADTLNKTISTMKNVYEIQKMQKNFKTLFFDGGHEVTKEAINQTFEFLKQ